MWVCQEHWSEPIKVEVNGDWHDILMLNEVEVAHGNHCLLADWLDICSATYLSGTSILGIPLPRWPLSGVECRSKSRVAWSLLVAGSSVGGYSTDIKEVGYVQQ
jgi:hypothetical protein